MLSAKAETGAGAGEARYGGEVDPDPSTRPDSSMRGWPRGVVDMADVEITASERLASGADLEADLDSDERVDFKVFAENRLREQ